MDRLENILVGVDFSECSRCALERAVRIANWNRARLRVVHAVENLTIEEAAEALHLLPDEVRGEARRQAVTRLGAWLTDAGGLPEHGREVIVGAPLDVLLREARTGPADLLVLGVSGDSMLPVGAGTLATKCLRKASCKVMLVKQGHARPFRRVVACVDFSETSRLAVIQALRIASQDRSEMHFLHVYQPYWNRSGFFSQQLPGRADFDAAHRTVLENNLVNFVNFNVGSSSLFAVRAAGTHAQGIAEYCREIGADLVVLGTRGKTNLKYVLLGSTVERLLREVPCSTLVVRPPSSAVVPASQADAKGRELAAAN